MNNALRKLLTAPSLFTALAVSLCMSACASQRMESPGSAWELVQDQEVIGAKSKAPAPASDKIVHTRRAVTLQPQMAGAQDGAMQGPALAARSMDERSATGWTRQALVQNWGLPSLIKGDTWVYRRGVNCVSLVLKQGAVSSSKPGC